jgi:hypothetical protein
MGSRRLEPAAVVVEMGVDANSASDGVEIQQGCRVGGEVVHQFEELFHDASHLAGAEGEEAGGMRVAIDVAAVGDFIVLGDFHGAAPANEFALDGVAISMRANRAAARVPEKIRRGDIGSGGPS